MKPLKLTRDGFLTAFLIDLTDDNGFSRNDVFAHATLEWQLESNDKLIVDFVKCDNQTLERYNIQVI